MPEKHSILGGKVHVYMRSGSPVWQCATFLEGKNHRVSTKQRSLAAAKDFAEDWFFTLRDKQRRGELLHEKTFAHAAERFKVEYEALTEGERNAIWVRDHYRRVDKYLIPFFGKMGLSTITSGTVQDYRIHRLKKEEGKRVPSRSTLHHEMVTMRMVMKTAVRHGWLQHLPDLSEPYRASTKVVHRAWFSPDEYKRLYQATRTEVREREGTRTFAPWADLHDKVLFLANTGVRPDEAKRIEFRDVEVVEDDATGETILEIEVRGKRGVGYCKSTTGAVRPFERLKERNFNDTTDRLFPKDQFKMFNTVLTETGLKFDRQGNRRTLYSLRHSYISFRLLEGADIYQIAKNCRTSVEMIEKHYAVHLKNHLDAAAINVRKRR